MGGVNGRDLRVLTLSPRVMGFTSGPSPGCWGLFQRLEGLLYDRTDLH